MSELTLNEQYAVTCKGYPAPPGPPKHPRMTTDREYRPCTHNYLSDPAEFARMVKALIAAKVEPMFQDLTELGVPHEPDDYICAFDNGGRFAHLKIPDDCKGSTPEEAAARACVALNLRVEP